MARKCYFLIEQPASSVLKLHPEMMHLLNVVKTAAGASYFQRLHLDSENAHETKIASVAKFNGGMGITVAEAKLRDGLLAGRPTYSVHAISLFIDDKLDLLNSSF